VDRKGRPPEYVPRPALTLGLCVQPEVLRDIAALPGFRGRGLLARILYAVPSDMVGRRKIGEAAIPEEIRQSYASSVQALTRSLAEWTDPAVLMLTPAAAELLLDAERAIEPRLDRDIGDLARIVDWGSKQIGGVARIAGLLHLAAHLRDGWGLPITEDTMRAALGIGDYYIAHALAAFDHMGTDLPLAGARILYRWLERTRPGRFTKREAHMGTSRAQFPKVGDLDAPLELLEQHGWIRRVPEPERIGPGRRPSPAYEVHPDLATETTLSTETGFRGFRGFRGTPSEELASEQPPEAPRHRTGRPPLPEHKREEILALRARGLTIRQVAEQAHVGVGTVHKVIGGNQ